MAGNIISHDVLVENLSYCKDTGIFKRKKTGKIAGHINKSDGYVYIRVCSTRYRAHALAMYYVNGVYPYNNEIDHINHIRADNRYINLRKVDRKENSKNLSLSKNSTTKHNGVSIDKRTGTYKSYITVDGKYIHLGNFKTIEDAVSARNIAQKKYGFHVNHGIGAVNGK